MMGGSETADRKRRRACSFNEAAYLLAPSTQWEVMFLGCGREQQNSPLRQSAPSDYSTITSRTRLLKAAHLTQPLHVTIYKRAPDKTVVRRSFHNQKKEIHFCTTGVILFLEISGSMKKRTLLNVKSACMDCSRGLRNYIIPYSYTFRTYCIWTQRHTFVAQAKEISNMLNELSSAVEEGTEFTLTRINMFGNSNSLHLTSLCEKKSRETFDNDIFHMIWAGWKSAFERQWSPGKLFVDHTATIVLRLSGLCGMRNSFGKQINSSFSWQFHWESGEKTEGEASEEKISASCHRFTSIFHPSTSESCTESYKTRWALYERMQMLCFQIQAALHFHSSCSEWTFCFPNLITRLSGMHSQRLGSLRQLPHPHFPMISSYFISA